MTEVTLASLAMDFNVAKAEPAKKQTDDLRASARALEEQAKATSQAVRDQAIAQGLAGTAAGKAETTMRGLAQVYGNAFNAQGQYNLSQDATARLILQNAKATDALTREQARAAKQVEALTRAYDPLQAEILKTNRQIDEAIKVQGQNGAAVDGLRGKLANLQKVHGAAAGSAKLQAYELANLGRQGADVFVQLASGQGVMMTLIQQGPQIADVFSTAAARGVTFRDAMKGLAAELGPLLVGGGLFALLAGGVAAVGVAMLQGEKDANKLANTLALAGSNAGLSATQFEGFARQVAGNTKSGVDQARAALLTLTETGKLSGETIKILGEDSVTFARLTGKSTAEAAGYFAGMGDNVADFAVKFQQSYGGLTAAQIEHIRLLEKQGATTQAQLELSIAIHKRLGQVGPENLGYLEKGWRDVGTAIANAWSWLKMWGNEAAQRAQRIPQLEKAIADEQKNGSPDGGYRLGLWQKELAALKATEAQAQKSAQAQAAANQAQIDGTQAAIEHANSWSKIAKNVGLANEEIARYRKGQADIKAANPNSKEIDSTTQAAAIEAAIRKRYEHLTSGNGAAMRAIRADNRGDNAIEQAKAAELTAQAALTRNIEQLAGIKAAQISQELKGQEVRIRGQVKAKEISQTDADAALSHYRAAAAAKQQALDIETANQIANRDLQQRQEVLGYTQRVAQLQAAAAPTLEKSFEIQSKALAERQTFDRDALQEAVAQRVISGDITLTAGKLLLTDQKIAQAADREDQERQKRVAIINRDLGIRQSALEDSILVAQSEMDLARSAGQRQEIENRIMAARHDLETASIRAAIEATNDVNEKERLAKKLAAVDTAYANQVKAANSAERMFNDISSTLHNAQQAIESGNWGSVVANLFDAFDTLRKALTQTGQSLQSKLGAVAAVADAVGSIIGGTAGSAISGAAQGAAAGSAFGVPGAIIGGALGFVGGIFGSSKAKKRARQQAAAQAAAEEAQRQQQIADYTSQFEIDTLRASGNEGAAVAMERAAELAALAKLSPALVELKQKYYDAADAAKAAADAAEKAAAVDAKRTSIQDEIDKLTLSSSELLAKSRAKERAEAVALDPTLGDLIDKLFGLQDAATAAADATAKAEADAKAIKDAYDEQARIDAYLAEQTNKVTAAMQEQAAAAEASANALAGIVNKFTDLSKTLNELADSLGSELTGATGQAGYAAARARLMGATGEETSDAIKAFLEASKSVSTSSSAYRADVVFAQALARQRAVEATQTAGFFGSMFSGLPGFADGGSAVIGGNAGVDQNVLSINGQPQLRVGAGELLTVTPRGQASNDGAQIAALREELAQMRALLGSIATSNDKMERTLTNVTEGGRAMQTEAAS